MVLCQVSVDEAVAKLLALKEEYKKVTGKDFPTQKRAPSAKKEKQAAAPKKEKVKEKTPEVRIVTRRYIYFKYYSSVSSIYSGTF